MIPLIWTALAISYFERKLNYILVNLFVTVTSPQGGSRRLHILCYYDPIQPTRPKVLTTSPDIITLTLLFISLPFPQCFRQWSVLKGVSDMWTPALSKGVRGHNSCPLYICLSLATLFIPTLITKLRISVSVHICLAWPAPGHPLLLTPI